MSLSSYRKKVEVWENEKCFHSFFEFLLTSIIKIWILFARTITMSTARASSVSIELYKHDF